jgi:hypothetical protein
MPLTGTLPFLTIGATAFLSSLAGVPPSAPDISGAARNAAAVAIIEISVIFDMSLLRVCVDTARTAAIMLFRHRASKFLPSPLCHSYIFAPCPEWISYRAQQ